MSKQTKTEALEGMIGELDDCKALASEITESLECAETVESIEDFRANVSEAINAAHRLIAELEAL